MVERHICNVLVVSSILTSCSSLLSSITCGRVASYGFSPKKTLILSDTIPTPVIGLTK